MTAFFIKTGSVLAATLALLLGTGAATAQTTPPPVPGNGPPPIPAPAKLSVFVGLNGQPAGPFDEQALRQMIQSGQLTPTTLVWTEGMADWAEAGRVPRVNALFTPAPDDRENPLTPEDAVKNLATFGTGLGVLFHEFGHAIIGETGLPATGPEEDVADEFSAFLLGLMVENVPPDEKANEKYVESAAEYAVLFWYYLGQQRTSQNDWQDEHAPDLKRFRNMFCLLYGSNPSRHEDVARETGVTERTRSRCLQEYAKRKAAWERILASVSRNIGPDTGELPADTPGGKITVVFKPTEYPASALFEKAMGDSGRLATLMDQLGKLFVLKHDLAITFRDCDELNAWYDPNEHTITMCYNFMETTGNIVAREVLKSGNPLIDTGNNPAPDHERPAPEPGDDAAGRLVGSWHSVQQLQFGKTEIFVTYRPDGTYESRLAMPDLTLTINGNWTVHDDGTGGLVVSFMPKSWEPRQNCDASGACQPITLSQAASRLAFTGPDTMTADGTAIFTRVK